MMKDVPIILSLDSCNRGLWLSNIVHYKKMLDNSKVEGVEIQVELTANITIAEIEPFHIVVLACLLEYIINEKNAGFNIKCPDYDIYYLLSAQLKLHKYFGVGSSTHEDSEDDKILNIWKVVDNMSYAYSISVSDYFSRKYYKDRDMTSLQNSMDEVYSNIADHSKAAGNAFSYVSYNPDRKKILVAACDFGLGIANTLRNANRDKYSTDSEALRDSINIGVTAQTTSRNRGMGLNNIVSNLSKDDNLRIISNKSLLLCQGNTKNIKVYDLDFEFQGTLIYFEISTNSFPLKDLEEDDIIIF